MSKNIRAVIKDKKATMLCVGPMSHLCIEVTANLSKKHDVPIQLIASRRQIDSAEFGGGYVGKMTTEEFVKRVRSYNAPKLLIARDHGGPWQSVLESDKNMDVAQSMESAMRSFETDIETGFDFIHIDPSIPVGGENLTTETIIERLLELYERCADIARQKGALDKIAFELGTEEQTGYGSDLSQMEEFIVRAKEFCAKKSIPQPTFIVAQTGTKVMETQNIGVFGNAGSDLTPDFLSHLRKTVALCEKHDMLLKEHNADYLEDAALALRPVLGIHASNVAPEFGVTETRALIYALAVSGMKTELDKFLEISLSSGKWKKWMLPGTQKTDIDRAVISGHYVFSHPEVLDLRAKLEKDAPWVRDYTKVQVEQSILRYMHLFRLV
ncbi:MAG: class II D-tagatose-bisphosphate aldolase, non-catalytic subunit [Alphaproteobacteria bacterium]|nr:class II D-tagatose-bisphosphate aldolase, non-catalytic subunit [Alphaproteobacteria bacterium]